MDAVGKVAIITGASRGIGKQVALALAERGLRLVIAARTEVPRDGTPGTLHDTADALRAAGADAVAVPADVARQEDIERIVAVALERHGHIDVLINNAAYTVGRTLFTHVPDLTREQWDRHFAVNVTAPLMLTQGVWRSMAARGGGVIVNVTSGAAQRRAVQPGPSTPTGIPENGPAYGASKAALDRMANVIAQEGLASGIAVINVDPGFVLTETLATTMARQGIEETAAISPTVPASAIAHLATCDDPMRYTGEIIHGPTLAATLSQP